MEESFATAGPVDKKRLKALSERSDAKGFAQLAGHGLALLATAGLVTAAPESLWLFPALVAHGFILIFLFAPLHETVHRTAFKTRALNDIVAWICGAVLMLPPAYFRAFHFTHHRHTQDPERDPELLRPKPTTMASYLFAVSGLPYWRERITTSLKHAVTGRVDSAFITTQQVPGVVLEARLLWSLYGAIAALSFAFESWAALIYWVVPAVIGQPFLRMYLLSEHGGCPLIPDMLKNSRTTRSNALVRRLAWNMPYHSEHHAYPALPFHALPAAHEALKDAIAVQADGYIAVQMELIAGFGR